MRKTVVLALLMLGAAGVMAAAEVQGVIVDWKCAQQMVKKGRQHTLKHDRSCSLRRNYNRPVYGLVTGDKKYYRLDGNGGHWARTLLKDSPDKDSLTVVVRGAIKGDTIQVKGMTEL